VYRRRTPRERSCGPTDEISTSGFFLVLLTCIKLTSVSTTSLSAACISASCSLKASTLDLSKAVEPQTKGTSVFFTTFFFLGGASGSPSTAIGVSSFSSISSVYTASNDRRPCWFNLALTLTHERSPLASGPTDFAVSLAIHGFIPPGRPEGSA